MAFVNLVHFAERLLNQSSPANQNAGENSRQARRASLEVSAPAAQDQFTPSPAPAHQEIGLFHANQVAVFSAAADFLFAQSTNQASGPSQPAASNTTAPTAPQESSAAPAASQAPAAPPSAAPANTSRALQTLNAALSALGLSKQDISAIDRVATLIHDFNPVAFASLVQQLRALGQVGSSQSTADSALSAASVAQANAAVPASASNSPAAANAAAAPSSNTYQIQELSIRFAGFSEQGSVSNPGAAGQSAPHRGHLHFHRDKEGNFPASSEGSAPAGLQNNLQFSAFSLQIEQVTLTLSSSGGQGVQIQAPPSPASSTASSAAPQT